ncbi:hypothetical protein Rumeso_01823 [Rubellimicrobium mesophilum DSM 19309]|uniref:Tellurite resistance TerB family protein n=1 Tax=Rubellimicrobium mesophilum DSM 19309 TaxID=442562 RepID=A0A017HRB1_9RHOB|nr:DUF533 domain-containing protein [Rubellimicrobium mesophilum]EYD76865.1 hypothetical protein Rumeso_01823 [Rubellimicrobium mesophilum DSM 19309]
MTDATARTILERLLTEGRALAQQAEDAAAERLGVGDDPASRQRLRQTGLAGGAALGVAAMLLGSRRRSSFSRNALLIGGLGALGKIAMDAWSKGGGQHALPSERAIGQLGDRDAEDRAHTILIAMVAAAKADGHIDEEEQSAIEAEMDDAPEAVRALMDEALRAPSDPESIAARVTGGQERREVYAASALLCGRDHPMEVDYLDRLARALGLSEEEARRIEGDVLATA